MVHFCKLCGDPYEDEDSNAETPDSFCSKGCEKTDAEFDEDEDAEPNTSTCQECFAEYNPDAASHDDGFCSDYCLDQYEAEIAGEDEEADDV